MDEKEHWTLLFSSKENGILQKLRAKGADKIEINDTLLIMDGDEISNSCTNYVKGLHKIFI